MRKLLAALLLLGASSAQAADLPIKATPINPPVVAQTWSGFYLGIEGGGAWSSVDNNVTIGGVDTAISTNPKGALVGIYTGYNWQFNPWLVFGIETDIAWSNIKATGDVVGKIGNVPFAAEVSNSLNWIGTTRARVGLTPMDNFMIYGTGGVAYGGVENTAIVSNGSSSINSSFAQSFSTNETRFGWAAGAGVEYALLSRWLLRVEYLHYNLGSRNDAFAQTSNNSGNIFRGGVAYKF